MIGTTIDGKYRVVRQLGEGGMGAVYEAVHEGTGRRVALKVILNADLASKGDMITRFQREARAAGSIDTQHIVQVFDTGVDASSKFPFMVMEFLAGEDISQLVRRLGPLPPELALRAVVQAAMGLQKAHEAGVIHRDIKPANLFLARREAASIIVKVLDFGIAKVTTDQISSMENASLTRTGSMLGSPLYMSPEQAKGARSVDHRTDIWSLGVVLYEALCGSPPNSRVESLGELILAICGERAQPIQELAPWVSPGVAQIVQRSLEIKPDLRFPSMTALIEAIQTELPNGWALDERMLTALPAQTRTVIAPKLLHATTPMPVTPVPAVSNTGPNHQLSVTSGHAITGNGQAPSKSSPAGLIVFGSVLFIALAGAGIYGMQRYAKNKAAASAAVAVAAPPIVSVTASVSASAPVPSAPVADAPVPTRRLAIEPSAANVEVDGARADVVDGGVIITGAPGSVHKVRLTLGKATKETEIITTRDGLAPDKVVLAAVPNVAPAGKPVAAQPPSTSTPAARASGATAPGVDRKTDEFK